MDAPDPPPQRVFQHAGKDNTPHPDHSNGPCSPLESTIVLLYPYPPHQIAHTFARNFLRVHQPANDFLERTALHLHVPGFNFNNKTRLQT